MGKWAMLYLRRKYKRSILLFFLLFVISFSLAIGVTVWNSIGAVTKEVQNRLGTSFNFRLPSSVTNNEAYYEDVTDSSGNLIKSYIGPKLNDDIIRTILERVDGISDYNAQIDEYAYVDNADLIPGLAALGADSTDPYLNLRSYMREQITMLYGCTASENYHDFRSGSFTLSEGRHITAQDQYTVLISDELAEQNNLQVGDTISLSFRKGIDGRYADPMTTWGEPLEVKIVGFFRVNGFQPSTRHTLESDIAANWIISDVSTVDYFCRIEDFYLYGGREYDLRYRNITFFVDDPAELDRVMKDVKSVEGFDTTYYEISIDDTMFKSTVEPLKSIRNIVAGVVGVIVAGCFIVLCVVFTMWVRSRRQEIAIYLSLGIRKFKIIGQFVLEASIVALVALALTFATCQQVPDLIGNSMLASTIETAQPEEKEYSWEEIGQAAMSGTTSEMFQYESSTYAGPESIDFSFGFVQLLVLAVLELLIIIAAICKGSSFIFKLQPRQILMTLS